MSLILLVQNEDCLLVIHMLLSCSLHDNQIYWMLAASCVGCKTQSILQLSQLPVEFYSKRKFLNNISFFILVLISILSKYVSDILCFSENIIQFLMYFLCTIQKEEDSSCVLIKGHILGYVCIKGIYILGSCQKSRMILVQSLHLPKTEVTCLLSHTVWVNYTLVKYVLTGTNYYCNDKNMM